MSNNNASVPRDEYIYFLELTEAIELIKQGVEGSKKLREIFDRYLEFPTLLDPHLDVLLIGTICNSKNNKSDNNNDTYAGIATKCRHYLQILLESSGNNELNETSTSNNNSDESNSRGDGDGLDINDTRSSLSSSSMYFDALNEELVTIQTLCKVRGYKTIQRFLPHEASDLEPILFTLYKSSYPSNSNECDDASKILSWEGVRVLLIWLAMLLNNVPFDLETIVSIHENDEQLCHGVLSKSVLILVQSIVQKHLEAPGSTREAAALCMASLLARPDVPITFCNKFLDWSLEVINEECNDHGHMYMFLKMGIVQALALLFKIAPRTKLLYDSAEQMARLWEALILILEEDDKNRRPSLVLRKLLIKLFSRIGCAYLPPKIANWRYQRGQRSLSVNKGINTVREELNVKSDQLESFYPSDDNEMVQTEVEDVIEMLLRGLCDKATVVRWSSAKGIGRVTERLPSDCADDVVGAVLEMCKDRENDSAWHGACLALAELSRRGLLLPERLSSVTPIIVKALQYDVKRGQHSVGAHVRDAACYTCWAFARAYDPSILEPFVDVLSREMILAFLFDREVNGRRAASAAFQECVGRQGAHNFKHGIDILTKADYFSLGNLKESYTTVCAAVATFDEYRSYIINRLWQVKLRHWDLDIRVLASQSLYLMSKIDIDYILEHVLSSLFDLCLHKDLQVRHGAILGVAAIVKAIGFLSRNENNNVLDKLCSETISNTTNLVVKVEDSRLYRGRGGELMRGAVCRLIESIAAAKFPLTVKLQVRYLDSIDSSLIHPNEDISNTAAEALKVLLLNYFPVGPQGPSDRLKKRVIGKYINGIRTDSNPGATRGYALALGNLPRKLLSPDYVTLNEVIDCLTKYSKTSSKVGDESDAELRRNCIVSLVCVCETVGIKKDVVDGINHPLVHLNKAHIRKVYYTLFEAANDYTFDRRGDVGSWCRVAAMESLERLTYNVVNASSAIPKQFVEAPRLSTQIKSPDIDKMCSFLEPFVQENVARSLKRRQPLRESSISVDTALYFEASICKKMISIFLKQLCEKIDSVRLKAGTILCRLLTCTKPRIPFIPHRTSLTEALNIQENTPSLSCQNFGVFSFDISRNWGDAATTFPLVLRVANLETYFADIIAGLIISVGGITESVVKNASSSMIEWLKALKEAKAFGRISRLGHVFIDLFASHHGNGRVLEPLLKTIDKLMSHGCLDELLNNPSNSFCEALVVRIEIEEKNCSDIKRLLAIIDVLTGILDSGERIILHDKVLPLLMKLLGHRYPRIRRACAESLYIKLQDNDSFMQEKAFEEVLQILLHTSWDSGLEGEVGVRNVRNKVADLLKVKLPESYRNVHAIENKNHEGLTHKPRDELESYSSLVKEAGR